VKPLSECRRRFPVTAQAERADVVEIALAAPFNDRKDVIGFP
jgi:hypothetical protein